MCTSSFLHTHADAKLLVLGGKVFVLYFQLVTHTCIFIDRKSLVGSMSVCQESRYELISTWSRQVHLYQYFLTVFQILLSLDTTGLFKNRYELGKKPIIIYLPNRHSLKHLTVSDKKIAKMCVSIFQNIVIAQFLPCQTRPFPSKNISNRIISHVWFFLLNIENVDVCRSCELPIFKCIKVN